MTPEARRSPPQTAPPESIVDPSPSSGSDILGRQQRQNVNRASVVSLLNVMPGVGKKRAKDEGSPKAATPNMTNEIRMYVRSITRRLIELGAIRGVPSLNRTPQSYWKFFPRARTSNQWEFLADKKTAVDFCTDYFVPDRIDVTVLGRSIDVDEFCACLQGPVRITTIPPTCGTLHCSPCCLYCSPQTHTNCATPCTKSMSSRVVCHLCDCPYRMRPR